ncbi:MAG: hypothetical protein HWN65_03420 [Candidatus Helarchaeota archaeon]|nr:hypothetical protein [Candidatus Helarchaeota archaeon]
MVEEQNSKLFYLGIIPKCEFYTLVPLTFIFGLIALGTLGIYFLNLWAAVGYSIFSVVFYFVDMPLGMCKYCYYRVKDPSTEGKTEQLLPKDNWVASHLKLHAGQKYWSYFMMIVWFLPPVLIIISFFLGFDIIALISLIGFVGVLAVSLINMRRNVCTKCAIKEECWSTF